MDICSKSLRDPLLCEQCLVCVLKVTLDDKNACYLRGERGDRPTRSTLKSGDILSPLETAVILI